MSVLNISRYSPNNIYMLNKNNILIKMDNANNTLNIESLYFIEKNRNNFLIDEIPKNSEEKIITLMNELKWLSSTENNLTSESEKITSISLGVGKNLFCVDKLRKKRGRQTIGTSEKNKKTHGRCDFDNLERKIQVHFLNFLIGFCNDALKIQFVSTSDKFSFKKINYEDKTTINYKQTSLLKNLKIKDILNFKISEKYSRSNQNANKDLLIRVSGTSIWLDKIFEMEYLKLFNFYYNECEPLDKLFIENKYIYLSPKTKSFICLLEDNTDLTNELISTVKNIYFNGNNNSKNPFVVTNSN